MSVHSEDRWIEWFDQLATNDYVVIDGFMPQEVYTLVHSFFQTRLTDENFEKAGVGSLFNHQVNASVRGDFIYWLDKSRDEELHPLFRLQDELLESLNRFCFLSLSGYEFHLAFYPAGTFYKKHVDRFKDRSNRMISVIVYLNEGWKKGDGGELKVFTGMGERLIEPIANRCVLFKSADLEHEVLETNVGRYSLTGWMLYQPSSLGYLLT